MNLIQILAALQSAPTLIPQLIQVLTDANKVVADFEAIMAQVKSIQAPAAPKV